MTVRYDRDFLRSFKKAKVIIRKNFKKAVSVFMNDPDDPRLNNHELRKEWKGYRSIDVTADWRAIYKEVDEGDDKVAYFVAVDTHDKLYNS